ncbi:hypothetical protein KPH14_004943 [Odynerus spinipes]|uniref:Uncharacterized protein n=1 Tax=Odynerus spinipes TaxID=1348599 RepID=A0AAD9VQT5_9HYME|nr:hypothetical protein KPH14_004943 [Odynerus spinipes]
MSCGGDDSRRRRKLDKKDEITGVGIVAAAKALHKGLSGRATERSAGVRTNTIQGVKEKEVARLALPSPTLTPPSWLAGAISQVLMKNPSSFLLESSLPVPD